MKKIVYLLGLFLMISGVSMAQSAKTAKNGPEISFEKTVHDYGTIQYNGNGDCEFVFTNTGNEPLILEKPKSSCGCTVPTWPKEPILPGDSQSIKVTYRTTKVGPINKTVTVTSNAINNPTVVLKIQGKVLEQPKEVLPTKDEVSPMSTNK